MTTDIRYIPQRYRAKVPIDTLVPHPLNPRQGDVGAIGESIEENGWYGALVVQKSTQHILRGNHSTQAASQHGADWVPVLELDCDDETALSILLVDNRSADLATYNDPMLLDVLEALARANKLAGTGYDGDNIDELRKILNEAPPVTSSQLGGVAYRIVIECDDEQHQAELLAKLQADGIDARAIAQ